MDGCSMSPEKKNQTARYFDEVEVQYENDIQKETIIQVLNDILSMPGEELRRKKYPNYVGEKDVWDLPKIIYGYFVADDSQKTLGDDLYSEVKTDEVQIKIKKLLKSLISDKMNLKERKEGKNQDTTP